MLDKLSAAEVRDADVIDGADAKTYGFDDPAKVGSIKVTVEEEKGEGAAKKKETRTLSFALGKDDTAAKKLYVRTDDWPRVNAVDDSLVSLAKRPALAYRGRRALDFAIGDVAKVEVKRAGETVVLEQDKGAWKLLAPAATDADAAKAGTLAGGLGTLEATEYVKDKPEAKDLETYGLAKDALAVEADLHRGEQEAGADAAGRQGGDGQAERVLRQVGVRHQRLRGDEGACATRSTRTALAYRPLQLWRVPAEDVAGLRVKQAGQEEYRLTRKDAGWQIGGPFEAAAQPAIVAPMLGRTGRPARRALRRRQGRGGQAEGIRPRRAAPARRPGRQQAGGEGADAARRQGGARAAAALRQVGRRRRGLRGRRQADGGARPRRPRPARPAVVDPRPEDHRARAGQGRGCR